jgi:hypothetical protein
VALVVFGTLGGVGVAWLMIAIFAISMSRTQGDSFVATIIPKLVAGGTVGFMAGLVSALFLLRAAPASTLVAWEKKFIGRRGAISIYGGIPMFLLVLLSPAFEPLARTFGNTAAPCIFLASFLVFVGFSLFLYDRIPTRCVIPLGLVGWVLTFTLACWYCWFGPGAFGQQHL